MTEVRQQSIDAMRFCFCYLVILLHCLPDEASTSIAPGILVPLKILCRSAVPFFFITSGYFLGLANRAPKELLGRILERLLPIYAFWLTVYCIYVALDPTMDLNLDWKTLTSGGAAFHLWYLPALAIGLAFVGVGTTLLGGRTTALACAVLAAIGLGCGAYHDLLGLPGEARRGGVLVAPAFVFIGFCFATRPTRPRRAYAVASALAALLLALVEEWWISARSGSAPLVSHDFILSTFLLGSAMFLLVRSIAPSPLIAKLASLGRISLGVYAAHLLILWTLMRWIGNATIAEVLALSTLTFGMATIAMLLLRRVGFLSRVTT
jgi:surface polysaccharide O-acyltransferase-like enzyme